MEAKGRACRLRFVTFRLFSLLAFCFVNGLPAINLIKHDSLPERQTARRYTLHVSLMEYGRKYIAT